MKQVPVTSFKDRVSEFVAEAQAGEEIIITRHGKEAARLVPPMVDKAAARKEMVAKIRETRESLRAAGKLFSSDELQKLLKESRP